MKVLIWIAMLLVAGSVQVALEYAGVQGFIPKAVIFASMLASSNALCKMYDKRKVKKNDSNAKDVLPSSDGVTPTTGFCTECGKELIIGSTFCSYCGTSIDTEKEQIEDVLPNSGSVNPSIEFCPECGNKLINESVYCRYCGALVIDTSNNEASTYTNESRENEPQVEEKGKVETIQQIPVQTIPDKKYENKFAPNIVYDNPLLKRAFMFLEDGEFAKADNFCEQVLNQDPENFQAYLGKLMAVLQIRKRESLADCDEPFDNLNNYQRAIRFADEKSAFELKGYINDIKARNENNRLMGIYNNAVNAMRSANKESSYKRVSNQFKTIPGFKDADMLSDECLENAKAKRIAAEKRKKMNKKIALIIPSIVAVIFVFVIMLNYVILPTIKYNNAIELKTAGKFEEAITVFTALDGYKDSAEQIKDCMDNIAMDKYNNAMELKTAGKFEEAIIVFTELHGYKDSVEQVKDCMENILMDKYNNAMELKAAGRYAEAITAFTAVYGYKDSAEQIKNCKYNTAMELKNAGKYAEAYIIMSGIEDYKDSAENAKDILKAYIRDSQVGDYITFGSYEQDNNTYNGKEVIEWIVLDKVGDKALIISKYALDCQPFDNYFGGNWKTCSLRTWLNGIFYYTAFSSTDRTMIATTTVTADVNPTYNTNPGKNTQDEVFLLSILEANKYFSSDSDRVATATKYAVAQGAFTTIVGECWWWLRSPGRDVLGAAGVYDDGSIDDSGDAAYNNHDSVRPALWINP